MSTRKNTQFVKCGNLLPAYIAVGTNKGLFFNLSDFSKKKR